MSESTKRLKEAAMELNKKFGLDPPINTALDEEGLTTALKEAGSFAAVDDDLTVSTWELLAELKCLPEELQKKKEEEMAAKKKGSTKAPAKTGAPTKKAPATKPKPKTDKYCREYSVIDAIMASKKALTVDELGVAANAVYKKHGGDDNVKQSTHVVRIGLKYLRHLGTVKISEEGKISKA